MYKRHSPAKKKIDDKKKKKIDKKKNKRYLMLQLAKKKNEPQKSHTMKCIDDTNAKHNPHMIQDINPG